MVGILSLAPRMAAHSSRAQELREEVDRILTPYYGYTRCAYSNDDADMRRVCRAMSMVSEECFASLFAASASTTAPIMLTHMSDGCGCNLRSTVAAEIGNKFLRRVGCRVPVTNQPEVRHFFQISLVCFQRSKTNKPKIITGSLLWAPRIKSPVTKTVFQISRFCGFVCVRGPALFFYQGPSLIALRQTPPVKNARYFSNPVIPKTRNTKPLNPEYIAPNNCACRGHRSVTRNIRQNVPRNFMRT